MSTEVAEKSFLSRVLNPVTFGFYSAFEWMSWGVSSVLSSLKLSVRKSPDKSRTEVVGIEDVESQIEATPNDNQVPPANNTILENAKFDPIVTICGNDVGGETNFDQALNINVVTPPLPSESNHFPTIQEENEAASSKVSHKKFVSFDVDQLNRESSGVSLIADIIHPLRS